MISSLHSTTAHACGGAAAVVTFVAAPLPVARRVAAANVACIARRHSFATKFTRLARFSSTYARNERSLHTTTGRCVSLSSSSSSSLSSSSSSSLSATAATARRPLATAAAPSLSSLFKSSFYARLVSTKARDNTNESKSTTYTSEENVNTNDAVESEKDDCSSARGNGGGSDAAACCGAATAATARPSATTSLPFTSTNNESLNPMATQKNHKRFSAKEKRKKLTLRKFLATYGATGMALYGLTNIGMLAAFYGLFCSPWAPHDLLHALEGGVLDQLAHRYVGIDFATIPSEAERLVLAYVLNTLSEPIRVPFVVWAAPRVNTFWGNQSLLIKIILVSVTFFIAGCLLLLMPFQYLAQVKNANTSHTLNSPTAQLTAAAEAAAAAVLPDDHK